MRFSFVFIFVLISVVFFSSESEASEELEENFTISLDPGWEYWKETNCRMETHPENGTYEECDYKKAYETNITDTDWIISVPLDSEFTFTLNGINFSSEAIYNFSYKIFTSGGYSGLPYEIRDADYVKYDIEITSSSLIFIRPDINTNSSFSYNLSGNLSSNLLINETRDQYLGDCVQLYAIVTLEKSNNSIVEWTKSHASESFSPQSDFRKSACWPPVQYQYANWGFGNADFLLLGIILVLGSAIIYGQAKLTSWLFRGTYRSKFTQYLAIFSLTILFITLVFTGPLFCIAAIVLFAQFVAYTTGHYEKPEIPADTEEGDFVDTKKSTVVIFRVLLLFIGIIFILIGLSTMMICSMSLPPQCGTLMDAAPFFSVSIICFILIFYLGREDKSKIDDKPEVSEEDQPRPK